MKKLKGYGLTNKSQLEEVFKLEKPDTVINVAAISDIDFADKNIDLARDINVNTVVYRESGIENTITIKGKQ